MRKVVLTTKYPFIRASEDELMRRIAALQEDNERLRAKVVAVQGEKQNALGQAENLRREKERLRERAGSLRKEISDEQRVHQQLLEKIVELQQELDRERGLFPS